MSRGCPQVEPTVQQPKTEPEQLDRVCSSPGVSGCHSHVEHSMHSCPGPAPVTASNADVFVTSKPVDMQQFGSQPVSFLNLMHAVLQEQEAAHLGLSKFLQLSLQPFARAVHEAPSRSHDLWPCPMPMWSWTGPTRLSPRRRKRRKFFEIRAQVMQRLVAVLNWETLGHPIRPPARACAFQPFTDDQWAMICRLERLVDHFLRADDVSATSLGRCGEKFAHMFRAAKELPEYQEVDLLELVHSISKDLDSYGHSFPTTSHDPTFNPKPDNPKHEVPKEKVQVPMPATPAKPVVASRIKWEHSPSFDPTPYLTDKIVRDAFVDPASVRLPKHLWVEKPKGRVHCSRSELLKLAKKWDSRGACRIFKTSEVCADEAVGIFAVPKDEQFDRLILNPQRVNARLQSFSHYTKSLAPGSLFSLIRLAPDQELRISADDLAEMYYTIQVSEARAKRNCIGVSFHASELKHLGCFDPVKHQGQCYVALNALAMGDSWAVEFAQQAHHNVLRFVAGCMLDHQRVAYRRAFPRSLFLEWLSIDDHIGVQILTKKQFREKPLLETLKSFNGLGRLTGRLAWFNTQKRCAGVFRMGSFWERR